jgi:hypothetical protein
MEGDGAINQREQNDNERNLLMGSARVLRSAVENLKFCKVCSCRQGVLSHYNASGHAGLVSWKEQKIGGNMLAELVPDRDFRSGIGQRVR